MKIALSAILMLLPFIAYAADPISESNLKQESCDFPKGILDLESLWKIEPSKNATVESTVNKEMASVGRIISQGDALFYVKIASVNTLNYFKAQSNIEVKADSFLSKNYLIRSGDEFREYGTITSLDQKIKYRLIEFTPFKYPDDGAYFAVKDDGFLCSSVIKFHTDTGQNLYWYTIGEYDAYQKDPLIKLQAVSRPKSGDSTIAILLVGLDDISATLGVKLIQDGKVVQQKEMQLDSMSGKFEIGGLGVLFDKVGKSSIKINAINEPSDYSNWRSYIKTSVLSRR